MKYLFVPLLAFLILCSSISAQISHGGEPQYFKQSFLKNNGLPIEKMPAIDLIQLLKEDRHESSKDEPPRFAYAHQVALNPENSGIWQVDDEGNKYWRLGIESRGARSLNFTFSDFYLPEGATLFFYNPEMTDVRGSFTSNNNKTSRKFGVAPIKGDQVIIEYYQPAEVTREPALHIATVAHDYKGIFDVAKNFGDSGACNNNVACSEGDPWRNQVRSVAMYTLSDGTRWCSGALINNTGNDGEPYFLTANHCLRDDVDAWVFYFNYESPDCSNTDGTLAQSISGSEVLATDSDSDYLLLKLSSTPPEEYNVYYSGWDATGTTPLSTTSIHHPTGDIKKISFDYDPPAISGYLGADGETHWEVIDWDDGTTEGGSSGSPLFSQDKKIIGQLHGGYASCDNDDGDWYGRLSFYFENLEEWLAPDGATTSMDGFDPRTDQNLCVEVTLTITMDNYPEETSWEIRNETEDIVAAGGTYDNQQDSSVITIDLCLENGCYDLVFKDLYGDGICCGYGLGNYQITDDEGILATGAAFQEEEIKNFCVGPDRQPAPVSENKGNNNLIDPLSELKIYPNPVESILFIDYKIKSGSEIVTELIDITGRIVKTNAFNDDNLQINVSDLSEGTYFLKIIENKASVVKKFVVSP